MKIFYLDRKVNPNERSFEKLFSYIKEYVKSNKITIENIENPYDNGIVNLFRSIFFFRKQIHKNDIVHITGQIHFASIALKTNKIVLTVHDLGLYRELPFLRSFIFKLFWIYLPFRKVKIITVISEKTKEEIIKFMPSVENKIIVIPNCVTIEKAEEKVKESKDLCNVLIVGTRSNKNIERAVQALINLPIKVIIVGKLAEDINEVLISNNINFENYYNIAEAELLQLYKNADILLFPSLYEGFGLPILEAQAQNVIVVTSEISPMKEVAGEAAIIVDPYSVDSIKSGVKSVLNFSNEEKEKMIKKGKENLKKYTIENISKKYIEIYEIL
ncbi:glycosyltransferase family 4 protein [Chryseobacterium jejuense]|uniref:D-inositol-3-phosphate glycosyltransferase n=1 Tax=Chryseobacterium jejuense TaxID=445960 RepID=A0A2X2WYL7_CHRJE|nr:glycosyltransferase family 1 protein [Chryseobacterium jejuense]SDJ35167.1 Glycosyltransferase involved in cell wall bisynthesis [Chryseobacterium jejuense]SQB45778.1 D-inositol-3-phosphate glycosyltransferase [Chryseobacterium jejuense]